MIRMSSRPNSAIARAFLKTTTGRVGSSPAAGWAPLLQPQDPSSPRQPSFDEGFRKIIDHGVSQQRFPSKQPCRGRRLASLTPPGMSARQSLGTAASAHRRQLSASIPAILWDFEGNRRISVACLKRQLCTPFLLDTYLDSALYFPGWWTALPPVILRTLERIICRYGAGLLFKTRGGWSGRTHPPTLGDHVTCDRHVHRPTNFCHGKNPWDRTSRRNGSARPPRARTCGQWME